MNSIESALKLLTLVESGYSINLAEKMAGFSRRKKSDTMTLDLWMKARDLYLQKLPKNKRGGWA